MPTLSRRQLVLLVLLTVIWGLNWPVMKQGLAHFPPLTFRAISLVMGLPVIGLAVWLQKASFRIPREYWGTLIKLAIPNVVLWHCLMILAIPNLTSGRAAILAYTMPIFSAVVGSLVFKDKLAGRGWIGVAAAALGVILLLWHEVGSLGSRPFGVGLMLISALSWAVGTQLLRRTGNGDATIAHLGIGAPQPGGGRVHLGGVMRVFQHRNFGSPLVATIRQRQTVMPAPRQFRGKMQELPRKILMHKQDLHARSPKAAAIKARV